MARTDFELACGKPVNGKPHFCDSCPLRDLIASDFLSAVEVADTLMFVNYGNKTELNSSDKEEALRIARDMDVEKSIVDPALEALSRHLGQICTVNIGE